MLGEHLIAAVARGVVADGQMVVRQLAREQARPGGAAQRVGAEGLGEGHAGALEPSYGGEKAQLVGAHVVGHHHDDVRACLGGCPAVETGVGERGWIGDGRLRHSTEDEE